MMKNRPAGIYGMGGAVWREYKEVSKRHNKLAAKSGS